MNQPEPTVPESAPPLCTICGHPDLDSDGDAVHVDESEPGGDDSDDWCIMCAEASPQIRLHPFSAPRPVPESGSDD